MRTTRTAIMAATSLALFALAATLASAGTILEATPRHSFQLRFGYFFPQGEGILWDDIGDRFTLERLFRAPFAHPHDEKPKLGSPVAEVIVADHGVAHERQDP